MDNLEERIIEIFKYWRGKYRNYLPFSYDQQVKFIKMLNKRISLSAAAGALIEIRQKELDKVNRVQDNYIEFISNYTKAFIIGGAGTGKTWIGIKKAIKDYKQGKTVLIVTPGELLCDYIKQQLEFDIDVEYFEKLSTLNLGSYDSIIVDEAQDFNEEQAEFITNLLRDKAKSSLYVMYDKNQKIYNVNFKDKFNIKSPPFILKENIRNTSAIHSWNTEETGIGIDVRKSIVQGIEPEVFEVSSKKHIIYKLENTLYELTEKEGISSKSIIILTDNEIYYEILSYNSLYMNNIIIKTDVDYKGIESDIVIYIHKKEYSNVNKYIGYSRARFYLYVIKY